MRKTASVAGVILFAFVLFGLKSSASAEAPKQMLLANAISSTVSSSGQDVLATATHVSSPETPERTEPKPKEYTVKPGETLSSIAEANQTTWQRIFAKNTQISDPNVINPDEKIIIPEPEEQLADRVPQAAAPQPTSQAAPAKKPASTPKATPQARVTARPGNSAENTYTYGYCTWYAKSRRPNLPNNLGNAISWVSRAAAQSIPTGSAPRVGAVGQQGNHVVYVEAVNPNGTVTVSEMNYAGFGVVSSRTVPASSFLYIY